MSENDKDSDALRARRYRAHNRGDHSLCSPERCRDARDARDVAEVLPEGGMTVSEATAATVAALSFPPEDPRSTLSVVAMRLAEAFDIAPSASLARELRQCLGELVDHPGAPAGVVTELVARRLARRVDGVITHALGSSGGLR
jgi:hypothetical protein